MQPPKRLPPTLAVRQRLFALSRNICAFPGCHSPIIDSNGQIIAQICHIESAFPGGERFNPLQSNEDRRAFENLMVLCYPHHVETNNVEKYTVDVLRKMKAAHERQTISPTNNLELTERFLDQSLLQDFSLPQNLGQLELQGYEPDFISHVPVLLRRIATMPQSTRSLYANAFIRSIRGDLFLCFSPDELAIALGQPKSVFAIHFELLERMDLIYGIDASDDWRRMPISGWRYYLCGLDDEDNGIALLYLIHQRFQQEPKALLDLFENLNFAVLDV